MQHANRMGIVGRWSTVALFAIAMAWVESAVVYYLRTLVDRIEPYQADPLPIATGLGMAELVRELATLIMLMTVGTLAARTWHARLGFAAVAFGVWDIFYYVFLKVMTGWPHSLLDWDILFLIPLPWWGPVLAPVSIAALMILWGTLAGWAEELDPAVKTPLSGWVIGFVGIAVALYVFMKDALRVADQGAVALRKLLPATFDWPLFCVALALMAVPVVQLGALLLRSRAQPIQSALRFEHEITP